MTPSRPEVEPALRPSRVRRLLRGAAWLWQLLVQLDRKTAVRPASGDPVEPNRPMV